jgi:hypothetical protein
MVKAMASPRCSVTYADGRTCKLVALRINPGVNPKLYTEHCKIHGGRQELAAVYRREAQAEAKALLTKPSIEIAEALSLGTVELPGPAACASSAAPSSSRPDQNPKAGGGGVLKDTTSVGPTLGEKCSIGPAICDQGGSSGNGLSEKVGSTFPTTGGSVSDETPENNLYTFQDRTLAKSFSRKLKHQGALSLNEELAMVKTLIQEEMKSMKSGRVDQGQWKVLNGMLTRAEKMINTIAKLEESRKVMYTRESLKMDLMKVLNAIRKWLPEEDRRRGLAGDLVRLIGPTISDPSDIVMTREVFKRG